MANGHQFIMEGTDAITFYGARNLQVTLMPHGRHSSAIGVHIIFILHTGK